MAKITKRGWVLPHGNTKIENGKQASDLVFALNESKFIEAGRLIDEPVEKIRLMFEDEYNIAKKKNPNLKPQDIIQKITDSRAFTSEDEMAISNLQDILSNSQNWAKFKKMTGIKNKQEYDASLWEYKNGLFIYNNLVSVHFAGNYFEELNIDIY